MNAILMLSALPNTFATIDGFGSRDSVGADCCTRDYSKIAFLSKIASLITNHEKLAGFIEGGISKGSTLKKADPLWFTAP
jgi:hypothetical protein